MEYVIGNIEGHLEEFNSLLEKVSFNKACDKLYILGDFIGNTYGCTQLVENIIQNTRMGVYHPILGDTEEMYIEALEQKKIPIEEKLLAEKGLIYSYYDNTKLRRSHMKFFLSLPKYIETDTCIFSHIGEKISSNTLISTRIKGKPSVEKSEKKHFYSHFKVNDYTPDKSIYVDKNTNSVLINKDISNISSGGLLLLNLNTKEVFIVKGTVI